jgi:hypothetical protein
LTWEMCRSRDRSGSFSLIWAAASVGFSAAALPYARSRFATTLIEDLSPKR